MRETGVRRLVVQSSLGIGDSVGRLGPFTRYFVFPFLLKHAMADHTVQERLVRESGLDWTILRPGYLNDRPASGRLLAVPADHPDRFSPKVSRADVAHYALTAATQRSMVKQSVLLVAPK